MPIGVAYQSAGFSLLCLLTELGIQNAASSNFFLGYFYWEIVAGKLDLRAGCEGWKNAENPAERFLKAYGEKEGSTLRKLVEVLRDPEVDLTHFASEIETRFSKSRDQGKQEDVNETQV